MTDNEIIKALECCNDCNCKQCPCYVEDVNGCREIPTEEILSLINRQRAEIDRLQGVIVSQYNTIGKTIKQTKANAIKEFAERLKKRLERKYTIYGREYVLRHLRELVKEMTEEAGK